ncbi:hypothetical protein ACQ1XD_004649 [Pseudomonas aeruginosa]|nr:MULTISPECIES: hypothetical protein [Pseudomonas]
MKKQKPPERPWRRETVPEEVFEFIEQVAQQVLGDQRNEGNVGEGE